MSLTAINAIAINYHGYNTWKNLLYLGLLSAVGSLNITETNSTGLHLTWTSPFSFDIPTYIHDVTFCVNITVVDPISSTTNMTCGIIETEFYFPLPYRGLCKNYKFIVIPVNVVGYGERERVIFSRALIRMYKLFLFLFFLLLFFCFLYSFNYFSQLQNIEVII